MFYASRRWSSPLIAGTSSSFSHPLRTSFVTRGSGSQRSVAVNALQPLLTCNCTVVSYARSFSSLTRPSFQAGGTTSGNVTAATAMDVAIQVNKLKKAHQSSAGPVKKEVEKEAWMCLQNGLTEEAINKAEGKAVALLLNSWAYFSKYWEKGKDGPLLAGEDASSPSSSSSQPESAESSQKSP